MSQLNFLSIADHSLSELMGILDRAEELHTAWKNHVMPNSLAGLRAALWFDGNGFRNRMAFEIGARAMGADVSYVPGELGKHEPLLDIGPYLANWFDVLIVRAASHQDLVYLADSSGLPVINARTNHNHPCEIMGDLQYIRQSRGSLDSLKVVFVGEVTNLCMSWFYAATRFPITVTQVAPQEYLASNDVLRSFGTTITGCISLSDKLEEVVSDADVIYTDCWPKTEDKEAVNRAFFPFQITADHLGRMNAEGYFLPCPPVTRGQEVSGEAMTHPLCKNIQAKEYLLHAQNAVMEFVTGAHHD